MRHLSEVFLKSSSGEFFSLCLEINLLMIVIQMFINKENTIKTCVSELQKSNFDLKEILLFGISPVVLSSGTPLGPSVSVFRVRLPSEVVGQPPRPHQVQARVQTVRVQSLSQEIRIGK
jgi:hypothetical protein